MGDFAGFCSICAWHGSAMPLPELDDHLQVLDFHVFSLAGKEGCLVLEIITGFPVVSNLRGRIWKNPCL